MKEEEWVTLHIFEGGRGDQDDPAIHPLVDETDGTIKDMTEYLLQLEYDYNKNKIFKSLRIHHTWIPRRFGADYWYELQGLPKNPESYKVLFGAGDEKSD